MKNLKNKQIIQRLVFTIAAACGGLPFSGCANNTPQYISHREPMPVLATSKVDVPPAQPVKENETRDLFIRHKELKIRRKAPTNETGSLTDLSDPRAYLFGFERPMEVGTYLDVKIGSNRSDAPAPSAAEAAKPKEVDEESLVKALPNLEAGGKDKPVLVKNIKMQIIERFDNGDVLVMYRRSSVQAGQAAEILVTARLPVAALSRPEQVSTTDLAEIDWRQSAVGEVVERKSVNWEDEYSLRISGFDETKSKVASSLEEKREQLKVVRDKLENELKAFNGERKSMTTERSGLLEDKAKDNAKIEDLSSENRDLKQKVVDLGPKDPESGNDAALVNEKDSKVDKKTAVKDAKSADKNADKQGGKAAPKTAEKKADKKAAPEKKKETKKSDAKPAKPKAAKG